MSGASGVLREVAFPVPPELTIEQRRALQLLAEAPNGQQFPLAHVFVRRGKKIHHSWSSELWFSKSDPGEDMRHVDFMWPLWSIFDCTPQGRGKSWGPQLDY